MSYEDEKDLGDCGEGDSSRTHGFRDSQHDH